MFVKLFTRHCYACVALLLVSGLFTASVDACSSCGCTLNSDWSSQGYSVASGLRMDIRQDYYDQDQLRSGTQAVDRHTLELPNDQELQQRTLNRNTIAGIDYSPSRLWGLHVDLPYFDRFHTTIGIGDTELSTSHSTGVGDVRFTAHYQGFSADLSWGVQVGIKLPTGKTDDEFFAGPLTGEVVDRGLQLGSGTTDAIVGVYRFGNAGSSLGYFAQATVQVPLSSHDGYKPGTGMNFNAGLRYLHAGIWAPQLQLNVRMEGREMGDQSDHDNSGATLVYLSPGLNAQLNTHLNAYAFLQIPVYQRVNGLQIQPAHFYSLGLQYKF